MTGTFWMKFRYTLPTWRPSPPSEPEDAPCSGDMTHLTTLAPITYHAITEGSKKRSPHSSGYSPASRRACLNSFSGSPCRIFGGKKWYWDTLLSEYVGFSLLSSHPQCSIFILLSSEYV